MNKGCLCDDCYQALINILVQENSEIELNTDRIHISSQAPYIEIPYVHENGNEYVKGIEADENYCCQCGTRL